MVIASILAAMLPVFGYAMQETLYGVHRTSSVGLLVVAIVHVLLLIKRKGSSGVSR